MAFAARPDRVGNAMGVARAIGLLCRLLLVMILLAAAALVARLYADGLLSRTQLGSAFADLADRVRAIVPALARSPLALAGAGFAGGLGTGWGLALWWSSGRLRRRPLLVADLRNADMPLVEAIRHVRRYAIPPVENDGAAMALILAEAGRGHLALWQRSRANMLRRVPRRTIRATALAMAEMEGESLCGSWNDVTWQPLMLLSAQVERLWPGSRPKRPLTRPSTRLTPSNPRVGDDR